MRELDFLSIIQSKLSDSSFLGDDCAFLDDLGIYLTQDTLVEDVHFSMYTTTPYLLGRKSIAVNLSDLAAALSVPKYVTVSLSMPSKIKSDFVEEFYSGVNDIANEYGVKVIGGDLTSSDKITISVCAIGKKEHNFDISRKNAKNGDVVLVTGYHGLSSAGFYAFSDFLFCDETLKQAHLNPIPRVNEALELSANISRNIAVMDSSDGLVDALYKISLASKHSIEIDINKVPVSDSLREFCSQNNLDYKNFVKWGGEDFELVVCVPEDIYQNINKDKFVCIGKILNKDSNPTLIIKDENKSEKITKAIFEENSYKHFK